MTATSSRAQSWQECLIRGPVPSFCAVLLKMSCLLHHLCQPWSNLFPRNMGKELPEMWSIKMGAHFFPGRVATRSHRNFLQISGVGRKCTCVVQRWRVANGDGDVFRFQVVSMFIALAVYLCGNLIYGPTWLDTFARSGRIGVQIIHRSQLAICYHSI